MEPRLKTSIWVSAYLRRCAAAGLGCYVMRKGDETAGSVAVKVNLLDGRARVFAAAYNEHGERVWAPALKDDPAEESAVNAYLERARARDPDLWVIEIEDRSGEPRLDGL